MSASTFWILIAVIFVITQVTESHWIGGYGYGGGYYPRYPRVFGGGFGGYGFGGYGGYGFGRGFYGPRPLPPPIFWG